MARIRLIGRCLVAGVVLLVVAGCASKRPAPVEDRNAPIFVRPPDTKPADAKRTTTTPVDPLAKIHVVQKGETLIAVALQYGLDYRELAAWNNITNVNLIQVGQELRVNPPAAVMGSNVVATPLPSSGSPVATPLPPVTPAVDPGAAPGPKPALNTAALKVEPKAAKLPYSDQALAELEADARAASSTGANPGAVASVPPPVQPAKAGDETVDWSWPFKGKLLSPYTEAGKGIDIAGSLGSAILAAADGKVIYTGSQLRGYGKLVIIKHNNTYLSAYAHNNTILVKEGQEVKKGQKVAEMGSTDTDQVKLHFEIRKQGKSVDPAKYLPGG